MLSQKAKYALKAMVLLAKSRSDALLQASEIAEHENIPKKFLDLILVDLRRGGFVESHRGKFGGYTLAKPADTITFGQIVRLIDGPLAPIPCASLSAYRRCKDCDDEVNCQVRLMMRQVRDAASAILDGTTLAEADARAAKVNTGSKAGGARRQ